MTEFINHHKTLTAVCLLLLVVAAIFVFEFLVVLFNGSPVPTPIISREPLVVGQGPALSYVIVGDSTAVSQGSDYQEGFAIATTKHLADSHTVTMTNVATSGARTEDVLKHQVAQALQHKPDIILLAVGTNDVTHLTTSPSVRRSLEAIIGQVERANCDTKIVITGAAAVGTAPRFPQPLKALISLRATQLNKVFERLATDKKITFAHIAQQTGPTFQQNPGLFAQDKFHPNAQGYAIWTPVLNQSLDDALANQPSRCTD